MFTMLTLLLVVYAVLCIVQFIAIIQGLATGLGCGCFSIPLAFLVAGCPILGTVLGVIGAHKAWGWSYFQGICLFFVPYLLGLPLLLF